MEVIAIWIISSISILVLCGCGVKWNIDRQYRHLQAQLAEQEEPLLVD